MMHVVTNLWGWKPGGIYRWMRWGWAWPIDVWHTEIADSDPRKWALRVKVGPLCFGKDLGVLL